jgi:RNA polymerase sigma factor (sigma-70 family)
MTNEEKLLLACQKNDRKAQTTFYNLHKRKLMGICCRYTSTREEAEDILQEAFIKIFTNIKSIKQAELVGAWVKRVTINAAIDYYNQNQKYAMQVNYDDSLDKQDDSVQQLFSKLQMEELLGIINQLADGYRIALNLYVIDGYSHAEIAKMLNISESTSKSQLSRAKEILRQRLKEKKLVEK